LRETEFSGTLLGFDDYVSAYMSQLIQLYLNLQRPLDMVLEDVTELYVHAGT
jgi:hypothetical protein